MVILSIITTPIGALIGRSMKKDKIAVSINARLRETRAKAYHMRVRFGGADWLGENGEHQVSNLVERYLPDDYVLLNDIRIPTENGRGTQIDHVVIAKHSVVCVETKNYTGIFYPQKDGFIRYPVRGRSRQGIHYNDPRGQSLCHARQMAKFLHKRTYHRRESNC